MARNPHARRIEALINVWSRLTHRSNMGLNREELMLMVKEEYRRRRVEPIRGTSRPPDIFEKELSALYAVVKYGLGFSGEY